MRKNMQVNQNMHAYMHEKYHLYLKILHIFSQNDLNIRFLLRFLLF